MILEKIEAALSRLSAGRNASGRALADPIDDAGPTVLQAVRTFLPQTENWVYEQVRQIQRYRSVFASKARANVEQFPFDPIYSLSSAPLHVRILDREIRRHSGHSPFYSGVAERERAKIIHAHGGGIATFIVGSAHMSDIPMVVSFYGTDMWKHPDGEDGLRRKYKSVFHHAQLVLAEGPAARAQLVRIGCPEERVMIHRLGVDVTKIPFRPRSLVDGTGLRVLMASRFVEKKGIPYGIEAFCRVARDNPQMRLTLVGDSGTSKDARVRKWIDRIATRHGVRGQVAVLGFMGRAQLRDLAEQHHVLLHPSVRASTGDSEGGHPVVMTMLAASGMPILATRHCDIPEVVRDGETGWLVSERNSDELEAKLRSIVNDPSMLAQFGSAGRQLVEEKYDIRSMRLDSVYDRVLPGG